MKTPYLGVHQTGSSSDCLCKCAASRQMGATIAMNSVTIFWLQLLSSVFVFSLVTAWYVWPALAKLSRNSALIVLLFVHVPRYVGMTLLVAGMVDPKLPGEFPFRCCLR